jgi:hypothetical protein
VSDAGCVAAVASANRLRSDLAGDAVPARITAAAKLIAKVKPADRYIGLCLMKTPRRALHTQHQIGSSIGRRNHR